LFSAEQGGCLPFELKARRTQLVLLLDDRAARCAEL
jgi:hypothetical protein